MRHLVSFISTLLIVLSAPAWADQPEGGDASLETTRSPEALALYQANCAGCHGATGAGVAGDDRLAGSTDFTSPAAVAALTRQDMIEAVRTRHAEPERTRLPDLLSDTQIAAIVDYVRETFMLPAPVADASVGRAIYAHTCSVCHGERGNGASWAQNSLNPPPVDFTSERIRNLTRDDMIYVVTNGNPETAMVGFSSQLSEDEIAAVVDYVHRTFVVPAMAPESPPRSETTSAPPTLPQVHAGAATPEWSRHADPTHPAPLANMAAPFPKGLFGDTVKGKAFFDDNCTECHGVTGDGNGRRAYFMVVKPLDFTSARVVALFNRPRLFQGTATGKIGTSMPAWSKVLTDQQIADVAEYVFEAFVRSGRPIVPAGGAEAVDHAPVPQAEPAKKN